MRRTHSNTTIRTAGVWHGWIFGGALIAVNAAIGTIAGPAEAAGSSCVATVTERLERLNVAPSDVTEISCVKEIGGRDGSRVVGITAWVSLQSCKGNLVFNMSRHGRIRDVYGRGTCDLGGAVKIQ
jgi:hypothetical protein